MTNFGSLTHAKSCNAFKLILSMKSICIISLIVFSSYAINAQSLERKVIAAGGASASGSLQLDYTIGEIAITTVAVNNTVLTQGFHQPQVAIISGNNIFPYLILYPNPTPGDATARFVLSSPATMTVSIYNVLGQ